LPESKDPRGASSLSAQGVVQRAIEGIRKAKLKLLVITDVCLCETPTMAIVGCENGEVVNDSTVTILAQQALSHARAGAISCALRHDGRARGAIRETLDEHKFENIAILSYAAKYCSGFYGPFREAAQSAPQFGDRRSYQMDPANAREALKEVELDLEEGADMVWLSPRWRTWMLSGGCAMPLMFRSALTTSAESTPWSKLRRRRVGWMKSELYWRFSRASSAPELTLFLPTMQGCRTLAEGVLI